MDLNSLFCARCDLYFDSHTALVHHQHNSLSHWHCPQASAPYRACDFDARDWLELCRHWNQSNCFHYCAHCGLSWLTSAQLSQHIALVHNSKRPHPLIPSIVTRPAPPQVSNLPQNPRPPPPPISRPLLPAENQPPPQTMSRLSSSPASPSTAPNVSSIVSGIISTMEKKENKTPPQLHPPSSPEQPPPKSAPEPEPESRPKYKNDELLRIRKQVKPSKRHFPVFDALWETPVKYSYRHNSANQLDHELNRVKTLLQDIDQENGGQTAPADQFEQLLRLRTQQRLSQNKPRQSTFPVIAETRMGQIKDAPPLRPAQRFPQNSPSNKGPELLDVTNARPFKDNSRPPMAPSLQEKASPRKISPAVPTGQSAKCHPAEYLLNPMKRPDTSRPKESANFSLRPHNASITGPPRALTKNSSMQTLGAPEIGRAQREPAVSDAQRAWQEDKGKYCLTNDTRFKNTPTTFEASLKTWAKDKTVAQLRQYMAEEFDSLSLLDQPPRQVKYWIAAERAMLELIPLAVQSGVTGLSHDMFGDARVEFPTPAAPASQNSSNGESTAPAAAPASQRSSNIESSAPAVPVPGSAPKPLVDFDDDDDDEGEAGEDEEEEFPKVQVWEPTNHFFEW